MTGTKKLSILATVIGIVFAAGSVSTYMMLRTPSAPQFIRRANRSRQFGGRGSPGMRPGGFAFGEPQFSRSFVSADSLVMELPLYNTNPCTGQARITILRQHTDEQWLSSRSVWLPGGSSGIAGNDSATVTLHIARSPQPVHLQINDARKSTTDCTDTLSDQEVK
jgi:hypothetical protein